MKVKMINSAVVPPFYWINQWRAFLFCCWLHDFTLLRLSVGRSTDGGTHAYLIVVIAGLGFQASWYDRIERAQWLAFTDQLEATAKDIIRAEAEENGDEPVVFEGEDDEDADDAE